MCALKKTWWISYLTRARSGWLGCFWCWPALAKEGETEPVIPKISQEVLVEMVGTTRPQISGFMNKFRKLRFIDYNGDLHIHSSLLNVLLHG
jgi:hypothetical protein